ncbi:MAG: class B sortase [Clostridia bacterium]|nr:class B sortase [Clostridia bacterium]
MRNDKKNKWAAVWVVSVVFVIAALSLLCVYLYKMYSAGQSYDDISSIMTVTSADDSSSEPAVSSNSESKTTEESSSSSAASPKKNDSSKKEKKDVVNGDVNFTELWKVNPDMYAWIKIPNTNIDYPVLQTDGDDAFYLSHNYKKEYEFAGSIYTEKLNKKDFSDPNTVLYGHNMLNGSMFRTLHNFRDPDFFAANPYIYIILPDRTLTYEIFSAYEYDDRHLLYSFDFNDKQVFADYLKYATDPTESMMCNRREIEVTADDKIITCSTCLGNIETSRYLVQGVLINDEPAAK